VKVAIPREISADERRVAATPQTVEKMVQAGMTVSVESKAGQGASIADSLYEQAGAQVVPHVETLLGEADVVLKVREPVQNDSTGKHELDMMKEGAALIASWQPVNLPDAVRKMTQRHITSFSLFYLPRIARAQSMDVLSSMSTLAGYKSVLLAANAFGQVFPMLMTAAGTLKPAVTLIIGAGVAGLQAIATAKRLGAVVQVFDVRPVVKEQVESLGAEFIELDVVQEQAEDVGGYAKEQSAKSHQKEVELIGQHVKAADIVITTALIPGKPAPVLVTEDMVRGMKAGSVIVDLATEQGGNCELSEPGKDVVKHNVILMGPLNLPSTMPVDASLMYANNISKFLFHLCDNHRIAVNLEDEITRGTLITHKGEILHQGVKEASGR